MLILQLYATLTQTCNLWAETNMLTGNLTVLFCIKHLSEQHVKIHTQSCVWMPFVSSSFLDQKYLNNLQESKSIFSHFHNLSTQWIKVSEKREYMLKTHKKKCGLFHDSNFLDGASAFTHLVRIMQGQHIGGHISFASLRLSAGLIQRDQQSCETQYFTVLQEKTSWHAWNLPDNGIKIKCGELWVPHHHGSTRHLFYFLSCQSLH